MALELYSDLEGYGIKKFVPYRRLIKVSDIFTVQQDYHDNNLNYE